MDICLSVCPPVNMSLSIFRHIWQFTMHFRGFRQRLVLNLPFRGSAIKLVQQLDPVLSGSTVRHRPLCRSRCTFWQEPTDCYGLISAINGLRDTWLLKVQLKEKSINVFDIVVFAAYRNEIFMRRGRAELQREKQCIPNMYT